MKKIYVKAVFCRIFKAVRPVRLAQSVLAACLFLGASVVAAQPVMAEGTADLLDSSRDNYYALYKDTTVDSQTVTKELVESGTFDRHMSLWKLMVKNSPTAVNGAKRTADSFGGVTNQLRVKFYAYEGEVAFLGSSSYKNGAMITLPDGKTENLSLSATQGHITSKASYMNGPNGVYKAVTDDDGRSLGTNEATPTTDGYNAFTYEIKQSGVYIVEFYADGASNADVKRSFDVADNTLANNGNEYNQLYAFDVTVCKNTGSEAAPHYNATSGRVWLDALTGQMNSDSGYGMYGYLYTTTRDGYIWRVALNGIQPYTVALYANQRGGIGKGTNASAYHSVHSPIDNYTSFDYYNDMLDKNGNADGLMIYGPDNETTDIDAPDHMFFNYPDKDLPESIVPKEANDDFSATGIEFDGRDPTIEEVVNKDGSLDEEIDNTGTVGVGGYFTVDTKGATSYRIIIDMSNMYARYYHGEDGNNIGSNMHPSSTDHDEEICLSTPWADSNNGEHINFIYYNSDDNSWYNIETQVKDAAGLYDMHPINNGNDMNKVVKYVKLEPNEVTALGLPNNPNGAEEVGGTGFKFKSLGKIMLGNAAVEGQTDRIYWNGRDQWGRILPVGQYFGNTGRGKVYAEAKAGEVHFPISDAEKVPNGLGVWLMNPPDSVLNNVGNSNAYYKTAADLRSKLYYNNREKSLLRDYRTSWQNNKGSGSLLAVWNLPSYNSNNDVGEAYGAGLNRGWFKEQGGHDFNSQFEDVSIEGKPSYSDAEGKNPTKTAGAIKSDGADHGIFDVWTHVISPNSVTLDEPITLYHFANRKIITGFVFLDTPEPGAAQGEYNRMTNDHELEGAIIVAEYGDTYYRDNKTENEGRNSGQTRWVHYEAKTDTDGYYSIPVDLTAFGEDDIVDDEHGQPTYPVTIWVYYNENISGAITHKVTTVNKTAAKYCSPQEYSKFIGQEIHSESVPSVSKQTVNIPKYITDSRGTANVYLKEIYAGQVGYIAEAVDQALTITKKWEPSYLKSSTLEASFTIVGMKEDNRTSIEEYFTKNADTEGKITVTEYNAETKQVEEKPYDQAAYTAKYGCKKDGSKGTTTAENSYMAVQHDPNFPSDETVASIKEKVDAYNAAHQSDPITVQDVLVNGNETIMPGFTEYGDKIIYVVENATVEEARGGIYTNKILPKQTYVLSNDNITVNSGGMIVYRAYENPLGSSSSGEEEATKTKYGIERIGNEWTYTNILNLTNYTLTLFHDKNADNKLTFNDTVLPGKTEGNGIYEPPTETLDGDDPIEEATVTISKMDNGGTTELGQFTHTLSDEALNELFNDSDRIRRFESTHSGLKAKDSSTNEFTEDYKEWAEKEIDVSADDDGVQKWISKNQEFKTDEHGQITFEGLSSGEYSIHVTYKTETDYNTVTVDGANSYVEVTQNELDNNEYIQKVTIGTESNYYSTIGLGFRAEMPLEQIINIYKNLNIEARPTGTLSNDVSLSDSFTVTASAGFSGTTSPAIPADAPKDLAKLTDSLDDNDKDDPVEMTAKVTADDPDKGYDAEFDEKGKNIIFYAPGQYTITVSEKKGDRGYIDYDGDAHEVTVVVANEPDSNGKPKITVKKDGTDLREKQEEIIIDNTLNTGYVTVNKEVVGNSANPDDEFEFTFTVTGAGGVGKFHTLGVYDSDLESGGKFTLKDRQSVTIYDIPVGATVKVEETENTAYKTTIEGEEIRSKTVEIDKTGQIINFKNEHLENDLSITQTVDKSDPMIEEADEKFSYTITIADTDYDFDLEYEIDGVTSTLEFKKGVANLELKKGQTVTIKGLPKGCKYTVAQTSMPVHYKLTKINGENVTVKTITDSLEEDETVTFNNEFEAGDLKIDNTVFGAEGDVNFEYTVELTPPDDGVTLAEEYTVEPGITLKKVKENEYSLTFSIAKAEENKTLTIKNLPTGTKVNITEKVPAGYVITKRNNYENIEISEAPQTAEFVYNVIPTAEVTVKKEFDTTLLTDGEFDFEFTVEQTDPKSGTEVDLKGDLKFEKLSKTKNEGEVTLTGTYDLDYITLFNNKADSVTYKYTVKETDGKLGGVVYDSEEHDVEIKISMIESGELEISTPSEVVLKNKYEPKPTDFTVKVHKTISATSLPQKDNEFTFKVSAEDGTPMPGNTSVIVTVPANEDESAVDGDWKITFDHAGEYTYTVTEEEVSIPGFSGTAPGQTVTVNVEDKDGVLSVKEYTVGTATGKGDECTLTFTNTYSPTPAEFEIKVSKTISDDSEPLTDDYDFGFELSAGGGDNYPEISDNTVTATVAKGAKKSADEAFGKLSFDTAGTYTFTVTETNAGDNFIKAPAQTFTVTVTDMGGRLAVTGVSGGDPSGSGEYSGTTLTFENKYAPKPASLTVKVDNIVALQDRHAPLADGHEYEFSFELSEDAGDPTGAVLPGVLQQLTDKIDKDFTGYAESYKTNASDRTQKIEFDRITFSKAGTYNFAVTEDDILTFTGETHDSTHKEAFITYPSSDRIAVAVTVEDINGQLTVTGITVGGTAQTLNAVDAEAQLRFINVYHADPSHFIFEIDKTVNGTLPDDCFTFDFDVDLIDSLHNHKVNYEGGKNTASISGDEFKTARSAAGYVYVDFNEPGDYTFTVTEHISKNGTDDGSSAFKSTDVRTHTVTVNVVDSVGKMSVASYQVDGGIIVTPSVSEEYLVGNISFTNNYEPKPAALDLNIEKKMSDGSNSLPKSYDFGFEISSAASDGATVGTPELTVTLNAGETSGAGTSRMTFNKAGTYSITVGEDVITEPGFKNHPEDQEIAVTVEDNGGELYVGSVQVGKNVRSGTPEEPIKDQTVTFINTYDPTDAEFELNVHKTVTGNPIPSKKNYGFMFNVAARGDNAGKVSISNSQAAVNATAAQLNAGANASFGRVTFSESGDNILIVTESGTLPEGFKENPKEYALNVHVDDNGGSLAVTKCVTDGKDILKSGSATVDIENIYDPDDVSFVIRLNKTVSGSTALDGDNEYDFTFALSGIRIGGGTAPTAAAQTVENVTESTKNSISPLSFELTFTEAGLYTFNLSETVADKYGTAGNCGFTLPELPAVTVTVVDNGTGSLEIESYRLGSGGNETGSEAVIEAVNFYNPVKVEDFEVFIDKTVVGDELPEGYGEFEFTLSPDPGNPSGADLDGNSVKVTYSDLGARTEGKYTLKDGAKSISKIDFTEAGTYNFTVTENLGYGGFTADRESFALTVNVIDDKGVLKIESCSVSPDNGAKISDNSVTIPFVNEFDAGSTSLNVAVNKTLTGNALPKGHDYAFTFTLYEDGAPVLERTVSAGELTPGTAKEIPLGSITYEAAGKHVYTASETVTETVNGEKITDVNGNNHGFGRTDSYTLEVTVDDKVSGSEQALEVGCEGASGYDTSKNLATLDFTNTYTPEAAEFALGVAKTVSGNALPAGHEYDFAFTLDGDFSDEKTASGITEGNKDSIPDIMFDLPEFTEAGEYKYTVSENVTERFEGNPVAGKSGFAAVDPIDVTVKIVDDGGKLRVDECTVGGVSTGRTDKYPIPITNRYIPDSVSVDDPKTPGGTDNNVVQISKILKTENGTFIDFPEAFAFNATVAEIDGAEKVPEPGTAGWGDDFTPSAVIMTTGGKGGSGSVSVSGLRFSKAGVYKVAVAEDNSPYANSYGSIRKDTHSAEIIYTVSDEGGKLVISDVDYTKTEFVNTFIPNPKTVEMTFDKKLINTMTGGDRLALTEGINDGLYNKFKTLYDGRFSFTMSHDIFDPKDIETDVADSGAVMSSDGKINAVNKMNKVNLGNVIIKREGSYTFVISENQPLESSRAERVGYGRKPITVTFDVTADPKTGELLISEDYMYGEDSYAEKPAFINTYGPIPCTLTVTTRVETDPEGLEFDRTKPFEYEIRVWGEHVVPDKDRDSEGRRTATFRIFYEKPIAQLAALENDGEEDTSVPVKFAETAENSGIYSFTVAGYGDNSFTIEDIPYGKVYYSVTQKLGASDNALGYSFIDVKENYTYKDSAEAVSRTEDLTDAVRDGPQTETGEFFGEFDGTVITYRNLYTVTSESETVPAIEKKMSGERGLIEGEEYGFDVTLEDPEGGALLLGGERTVTAVASADPVTGEVTAEAEIGNITFTKPGVYTVSVREIIPAGELKGVLYDNTLYTVVYTVTDYDPAAGIRDGKLRADRKIYADGEEAESIVFTNAYSASDTGEVIFDISDIVIPSDPNALADDEEYRFTVTDENGLNKDTEALATVYSKDYDSAEGYASGKTSVSLGTFGDPGTYSFTVSEIPGNTLGMIYDQNVHTVTVEVRDNLKGGLEYEVYADGILNGSAEFVNRYMTGSVTVTNTLTGTGIDATLPFEYKVTVTGADSLPGIYNCEVGSSGGISPYSFGGIINPRSTSSSGKLSNGGTVELKHNGKFTISGIPEGAMVKIGQLPMEGYTTSVNVEERYDFSATVSGSEELRAEYLNRHYTEYGRIDGFVSKSQTYPGDGESVRVGDTLSYSIDWRNPKLRDSVVIIKDTLSEGVDLIKASDGYEYDPAARTVTWKINAKGLEAGSVDLSVKVNEQAPKIGSINNASHAEIYDDTVSDPEEDEPSAEDDSEEIINPVVALGLVKNESLDGGEPVESLKVRAGDIITYNLTATVSGPGAENLTIADVIPKGLEYVGSSDKNAVYDPVTGTVRWTFADTVEPGEITVSYSVKVPEVSAPAGWSSCGYVYEGHEAAPASVGEDYPWISSNYVEALPVSDLTVKKTVHSDDGIIPAGIKFRFTVEITDENGMPASGLICEKDGVRSSVPGGRLLVNLGDGESVTLCDVPAGSAYTVFEEPVANYSPDPGNVYGGILKNVDTDVGIVNNYEKLGSITVTKTVKGTDDDMLRRFGFTITLSDTSINGTYGDLEFIGGTAQFSLANGEEATAALLPAGIEYTVYENAGDAEDFTVTDSGNTIGKVPENGEATVAFINERKPVESGGLTVKNTVIGGSRAFSFEVRVYGDQPISGQYGDMVFDGAGTAVFTLAPGQSISADGIPAGTHYTVTEIDADADGYVTEFRDGCGGVIPANSAASVEFINTRRIGSLTVKNTVVGGDDVFSYTVKIFGDIIPGYYGDMYFEADGTALFTLSNGESVTASGLPAGAAYEVTEIEANQRGYVTSSSGASGTVAEGLEATASFVNTLPEPCILTVSKTVIGGSGNESFTFSISLHDSLGEPLSGVFGGIETGPDGTAVFSLSDGMSINIPLPEGTVYSVSEDLLSASGYISEVSGNPSGTVTSGGAYAAFTNTLRTGSLTVSDCVGGNASDPEKTFTFTVAAPVVGQYGDMLFDMSGTATFTLGHGQSATAEGLPAGITYTVAEADANTDGYVTECNGAEYTVPISGMIAENTVSEVKFRNIKQVEEAETVGSLTVVNNIVGTVTDEEFMFTVTVEDPSGIAAAALSEEENFPGARSISAGPNGETIIRFALKHGESKRIDGLPAGTRYTVTESGSLYYLVSSVNSEGVIPSGENRTAVFTNRWNAGNLSVEVTVEDENGIIRADDRAEFAYRVTLDGIGSGFAYPSHITENYTETEMSADVIMRFDENGVAEFTLRGGQRAAAPDLPAGIGYRVELISRSDERHYDKSESGTVGIITAGETSEAEFVYYIRTGSLSVAKKLLDLYNGEIKGGHDFEFDLRLYGSDGLPLDGAYAYDGSRSGTAADSGIITLRGGESITVYGLPEGAEYSVTERRAEGYPLISEENSSGIITAGEDIKAVFTNRMTGYPARPQRPGGGADPGKPDPDKPGDSDKPDKPEDKDDPDEPEDQGTVEIVVPTEGLNTENREETEEVDEFYREIPMPQKRRGLRLRRDGES